MAYSKPFVIAFNKPFFLFLGTNISAFFFKKFISSIPPLIKGYIRLGAFVGDGAVIDYDFNTTDICIVLPTKKVAARYMDHFDRK